MANYLTVFRNFYKKNDKQPDLRGFIRIEEALQPGEYEMGLYEKIKDDKKYYSGTIKPKLKEAPKHWGEND